MLGKYVNLLSACVLRHDSLLQVLLKRSQGMLCHIQDFVFFKTGEEVPRALLHAQEYPGAPAAEMQLYDGERLRSAGYLPMQNLLLGVDMADFVERLPFEAEQRCLQAPF